MSSVYRPWRTWRPWTMPANTGGGGNTGAAGTLNIKKGNAFFKLNGTASG